MSRAETGARGECKRIPSFHVVTQDLRGGHFRAMSRDLLACATHAPTSRSSGVFSGVQKPYPKAPCSVFVLGVEGNKKRGDRGMLCVLGA